MSCGSDVPGRLAVLSVEVRDARCRHPLMDGCERALNVLSSRGSRLVNIPPGQRFPDSLPLYRCLDEYRAFGS